MSSASRAWTGVIAWLSVVLRQIGPILVPAAIVVISTRDRRLLIVAAPFAALSAYSISVGGDAWEYFNFANRYLTAGLPPLCVLAGVAMARVTGGLRLLGPLGLLLIAGGAWDITEKIALPNVAPALYAWGAALIIAGAIAIALRHSRHVTGTAAATACLLFIVAASDGRTWAHWLIGNAHAMDNDRLVTRLGVAIRETTSDTASVAAYLAGSTPYFARRRSIDLFGKSDPHVARLEVTAVHPGHNKVDLPYSLGLRPDVVVTFAEAPEETRTQLLERGYVRLCAPIWARADSMLVDRAALGRRCA